VGDNDYYVSVSRLRAKAGSIGYPVS
jgi:hypothetical protein